MLAGRVRRPSAEDMSEERKHALSLLCITAKEKNNQSRESGDVGTGAQGVEESSLKRRRLVKMGRRLVSKPSGTVNGLANSGSSEEAKIQGAEGQERDGGEGSRKFKC